MTTGVERGPPGPAGFDGWLYGVPSTVTRLLVEVDQGVDSMSLVAANGESIIVAGLEIPSRDPVFLATIGVHVLLGLTCTITGLVAMLSAKRPGRHPRFGSVYFWCLAGYSRPRVLSRPSAGARTITCSFSERWPSPRPIWDAAHVVSAAAIGRSFILRAWACPTCCCSPPSTWTTARTCPFGETCPRLPSG